MPADAMVALTFFLCLLGTLPLICVNSQSVLTRDLNQPLLTSYDFIIVGGGVSGLVVANRLTENSLFTVLVIEAGVEDQGEASVEVPVNVGLDIGGKYDWNLATVNQNQLNGATRPLPQGKALGGGSIINAMVWNRGTQDDYNVWESLGNEDWGWNGMLPYFKKSETYYPVTAPAITEQYSIHYNSSVHGFSGPVHVSYPRYFYNQSVNFFQALNFLGVPTAYDPQDGTIAGASFCPADVDPMTQTRHDARRAYFDPYSHRPNLYVITGQHVTKILISGFSTNAQASAPSFGGHDNSSGDATSPTEHLFEPSNLTKRQLGTLQRVFGVELAPNASSPRLTINATREVILAAGAIHTPQLLELSGIGSTPVLESLNISVAMHLPGVGNNLQDHCLVGTFYPYNNNSYVDPRQANNINNTLFLEYMLEYIEQKTGPWTTGPPNAIAFLPLSLITNYSNQILQAAQNQSPIEYLPVNTDSTFIAGFTLMKKSLVERLGSVTTAAYEIVNNNAGSLTVSVMHPLSRGTTHITSVDPFETPAIDPRWLSNPTDRAVLLEALLFNRRLLNTTMMQLLQPAQFSPPVDANISTLHAFIDNGVRTEFHPSGTCAMLPQNLGGVLNSRLLVYGFQNLRVVDSSMLPMIPGAHLQAVMYGVGEKAADIIKSDNGVS